MNRSVARDAIGYAAAGATALQSACGLGRQLYLACTQGTDGLSLILFLSTFLGMSLWAIWAFTKPGGAESIIAWPNAFGACLAFLICAAILIGSSGQFNSQATEFRSPTSLQNERVTIR